MFMNDFNAIQSDIGLYTDEAVSAEVLSETAAFDELLHIVDAARTGLVADEHDYDSVEEETS